MLYRTDDLRIVNIRPLLPPAILMEELPITEKSSTTVARGREQAADVLHGRDDRLLVVVGPCSIHDPKAGLEYGHRLHALGDELSRDLLIIMRVYFEKPRTTVGWKGLINDPHLDESFAINEGLRHARRLLCELGELGMPAGCEFLDPITPQFLADLVSWGAIGARTSESQVHRELASGLSMPVGFKNATDGGVRAAVDGMRSAAHPHHFLSVTKEGVAAIVGTAGNRDTHVILRGGESGTNFDAASLAGVRGELERSGMPTRVMVDCSHGNSRKDYARQPEVSQAVARQVAEGSETIMGVMLESFLVAGRQDLAPGRELVYGQSITDACMSWDTTVPVLRELAEAVRKRRERR
jgi:3-deoxy-7-phosphoheptulonate synthase